MADQYRALGTLQLTLCTSPVLKLVIHVASGLQPCKACICLRPFSVKHIVLRQHAHAASMHLLAFHARTESLP